MLSCWSVKPDLRPTFRSIFTRIGDCLLDYVEAPKVEVKQHALDDQTNTKKAFYSMDEYA